MICFVHIERAAGTTLHAVFRNNHPFAYTPLTPTSVWANEPDHVFSLEEARFFFNMMPFAWGFGGHTVRSYLPYERVTGRPVQYVTFLRDPVARYISHYNYHRKVIGIDWRLEDFLRDDRLHNFMTRRLAGRFDLDAAKQQLAERMAFVGLTDRFDESLILLRRVLGLSELCIHYEKQNTSRQPRYAEDDELRDGAVAERIREANALDIGLYEFAARQIYPAYVERFGPGLDRAVAEFRKANAGFRFSRMRRACWTAYRHLGYRNLERILRAALRPRASTYRGIHDEAGAASA